MHKRYLAYLFLRKFLLIYILFFWLSVSVSIGRCKLVHEKKVLAYFYILFFSYSAQNKVFSICRTSYPCHGFQWYFSLPAVNKNLSFIPFFLAVYWPFSSPPPPTCVARREGGGASYFKDQVYHTIMLYLSLCQPECGVCVFMNRINNNMWRIESLEDHIGGLAVSSRNRERPSFKRKS